MIKKIVTSEFYVDQYDNVFDENRYFYCKWNDLNEDEQNIVKENPFSAY